uniref:Uncharacterized protein n=1 Tax=Parascaris equorum TaxID=6256 RepID=A0A914SH01_PAREQ
MKEKSGNLERAQILLRSILKCRRLPTPTREPSEISFNLLFKL